MSFDFIYRILFIFQSIFLKTKIGTVPIYTRDFILTAPAVFYEVLTIMTAENSTHKILP